MRCSVRVSTWLRSFFSILLTRYGLREGTPGTLRLAAAHFPPHRAARSKQLRARPCITNSSPVAVRNAWSCFSSPASPRFRLRSPPRTTRPRSSLKIPRERSWSCAWRASRIGGRGCWRDPPHASRTSCPVLRDTPASDLAALPQRPAAPRHPRNRPVEIAPPLGGFSGLLDRMLP